MAHLFDNAPTYSEEREASRRAPWFWVAGAVVLALVGAAAALAWHSYGGGPWSLPSIASLTAPSTAAPTAAPASEPPVSAADFRAFQQQIAGSLQSTAQLVAAEQAEIKRLSDQVAALSAKIETLQQQPAATAQAAVPAAAPTAPRKRPAASPKQPPAISVGGAPLPSSAR